jgi:hypothetical protein
VCEREVFGNRCRIGRRLAARLHDFEAIAEGVIDEEAALTLKLIIGTRSVAGIPTSSGERIEVRDVESHMSLPRGAKLRVDPEVELSLAELEPGSASHRQGGRLRYLAQAEHLAIEAARLVLEATGHRDLYVIDAQNGHVLVLR